MLHGTVHKFGDHIDTDVIIPARYLSKADAETMAAHCMEDIDPNFVNVVKKGDIIVAGRNFGCGSSREHAPFAIKSAGVSCVIAVNFARIFFRNAINIGLPVLECPQAAGEIGAGDVLSVDLEAGLITDETTGKQYKATAFPPFMQKLIDAGGLVKYTVAQLQEAGQ